MDTSTGEVTTEDLRRDIETRRDDISRDLTVIGDRVSPGRMADRGRERARRRVSTVRERMMGSVDDARTSITDTASAAGGAPSAGADAIQEKVKGSPLAMGFVAFGLGFVAGAVLPASSKERDLVHEIEPQLEHAAQAAGGVAREAVEHVTPAAQEEAASLKDEAQQSAETVRDSAQQ